MNQRENSDVDMEVDKGYTHTPIHPFGFFKKSIYLKTIVY